MLKNENGSERCFLAEYVDDDSDRENINSRFEEIHEQKEKEFYQLINANPEVLNDPLVRIAGNNFKKEKQGMQRAKIVDVVGRNIEENAITTKYLEEADIKYYSMYQQNKPAVITPSPTKYIKKQPTKIEEKKEEDQTMSISEISSDSDLDEKETEMKRQPQALCS